MFFRQPQVRGMLDPPRQLLRLETPQPAGFHNNDDQSEQRNRCRIFSFFFCFLCSVIAILPLLEWFSRTQPVHRWLVCSLGFLATLDNVIGWGFVCLQFGFSGYFGQCYWVGFCLFVCCFLFVLSVFLRPWTVLLSRFLFVSLFCSLFPPFLFSSIF